MLWVLELWTKSRKHNGFQVELHGASVFHTIQSHCIVSQPQEWEKFKVRNVSDRVEDSFSKIFGVLYIYVMLRAHVITFFIVGSSCLHIKLNKVLFIVLEKLRDLPGHNTAE